VFDLYGVHFSKNAEIGSKLSNSGGNSGAARQGLNPVVGTIFAARRAAGRAWSSFPTRRDQQQVRHAWFFVTLDSREAWLLR